MADGCMARRFTGLMRKVPDLLIEYYICTTTGTSVQGVTKIIEYESIEIRGHICRECK